MIWKCPCCGRYIYPHEIRITGICPYCGADDLVPTDEDEQ